MIEIAISAGLLGALLLAGAGLAFAPVAALAKRAALTVLLVGFPFLLALFLPRENLDARGVLCIFAAFFLGGTFIAVEWRARYGVPGDSPWLYVADALTLCSSRTVPELAVKGGSVPRRALRGAACFAASAGISQALRHVAPESLPLLVWLYLKLHVVGLGAQASSDLTWAAWRGTKVPLMRWPLLSTSFLDFWGRRYNLWVHGLLLWTSRELFGLRRRPKLLLVAAFLLSGALHEVLSVLLLGRVTGWFMGFWVAQVVLTFSSVALSRALRGSRLAPVVGLIFVHLGMCLSACLFFAVFDRVHNLFGPVTPAPW